MLSRPALRLCDVIHGDLVCCAVRLWCSGIVILLVAHNQQIYTLGLWYIG
jgi:hypothetical protein